MTKWPWLMIILALISMVQRTYSMTHKYTPEDATLTSTPRNMEYQSIGHRANIKNTNVSTVLTSNRTSYELKNEYSTNNSNTQFNNSKKLPANKLSSIITFPNSIDVRKSSGISAKKFIPDQHDIDKCSKNESFCVEVDNYPRQDVLRILRTSKFMSSTFFGVDTINDLETRFSFDNLQPFCESREEIIFPDISENKNNEWRYIVQDKNDNSNYRQGIRVEKCVNAGDDNVTKCTFDDHLPIGYTTMCVQKFMYKKLVAIKETNEIYYDSFKLPSCCMCMYTVNSDLLTRKGGLAEDQTALRSRFGHVKKN